MLYEAERKRTIERKREKLEGRGNGCLKNIMYNIKNMK